jgi:hypothetical protein
MRLKRWASSLPQQGLPIGLNFRFELPLQLSAWSQSVQAPPLLKPESVRGLSTMDPFTTELVVARSRRARWGLETPIASTDSAYWCRPRELSWDRQH